MKTERNILIAFILNLVFSVFEFFGGIFTGSVAIVSDALHDVGDAASIGISYFLERKSKKQPDEKYTYGYARYSAIGGAISTLILLIGSALMIYSAVGRMITPTKINYDGMIVFAVVGVCINFCAAFITRKGSSLNQRAVSLHMLEDVLGWAVVLSGAVVMRFTDLAFIDPLMSIGVSVFILVHAIKNLRELADLFLEKAPRDIELSKVRESVEGIEAVLDVHHIHIWSMGGQSHFATMHVVADAEPSKIKDAVRKELRALGIGHVTLELESSADRCSERECHAEIAPRSHHHHDHGHHRH